MIDCVSVANMRASDHQTIENGTSSLELIRRAAYCVSVSATWKEPVAIVCGSGNNGADGFALASILRNRQIDCTVFTVSQRLHEDAAYYAEQAKLDGIPVCSYEAGCLQGYSTIVDCMLGTGFQGSPKPVYRQAMEEINGSGAYTVSVDINSGMNGDTGNGGVAVVSDLTVTIGFVKVGQVQPHAGTYMKRLVCVDVGIGLKEREYEICTSEEWQNLTDEERDSGSYILCPAWLDMEIKRDLSWKGDNDR